MTEKLEYNEYNRKVAETLSNLERYGGEAMKIDPKLFQEYDVKRGLRDSNGKGVLTGLTEVSDVNGYAMNAQGKKVPCDGQLFYQGYDVRDLVKGTADRRYGFEEISYLLLFGELPSEEQMDAFLDVLDSFTELPDEFTRDIIMKAPSDNMMNSLQRCVLSLYSYDDHPEELTFQNVLSQSLNMIAKMPLLAVYSYRTYCYYRKGKNLIIRNPEKGLSLAENLLQMLHEDGKYSELEAKVLDVALILHAEHGGGNNSTFTTHVITSTGTDSYSAIAASLGSLKGPKHGGANLKAQNMFENIKANIQDWENEDEIRTYLTRMLDKEVFDHAGLIYGMGHAVYTVSDPRCVILKEYAKKLAIEKGREDEFALYDRLERIGGECIAAKRNLVKPVCANVDFYSGFVYTMLGLPKELYTPLFATARISGWCSHRIEELVNSNKIIRPAYKYVGHHKEYTELYQRDQWIDNP
ncbi:MAG: citrate/2-methylcitrate synthase [Lachnospiraceae bacterium]|nr:citrate/2-methylcitrate synthase [Lachnospiraceae bacterium]